MIAVDLYERIDAAVVTVIRNLAVQDVATVESQVYPDISALDHDELMLVSVHEDSESEEIQQNGSPAAEAQWFPVRVSILDKMPADVHARKPVWMRARATILNAFRLQPGRLNSSDSGFVLDNCPEVKRCRIDTDVVFDSNIPAYKHVRTGFRLNFRAVCTQ